MNSLKNRQRKRFSTFEKQTDHLSEDVSVTFVKLASKVFCSKNINVLTHHLNLTPETIEEHDQ